MTPAGPAFNQALDQALDQARDRAGSEPHDKPGPARQRVAGIGELGVRAGPPQRALQHLYQQGAARIRLPSSRFEALEAVLINTAGGLTGDDRLGWSVTADAGARVQLSTSAAEKVYRTHGPPARVTSRLQVGAGATLEWLPQETILFDAASLTRDIEVELAPTATLLLLESVILGRKAMGERLRTLQFSDRWRIRRGGHLLHAEALQLNTDTLASAASPALLGGCAAFATVLYSSPDTDERLQQRATAIRQACATCTGSTDNPGTCIVAVSVLPSRLVVRLAAIDGRALRGGVQPAIAALSTSPTMPRVWEV